MIHALIGLKLCLCLLAVLWCTVSAEVIKPYKNNFFAILQVVKAITAPLSRCRATAQKASYILIFLLIFKPLKIFY